MTTTEDLRKYLDAHGIDGPLSLSELRRRLSCGEQVDLFAHGGCGCFIDAEEAA